MTVFLGTYAPARLPCAGAATPGAKALMAWFLGVYAGRGGTNLGIYGCRPVGGTTVPSVHGAGRACDLGIPVGASWGQPLADWLHDNSAELGIQQLIYRRRIWSCNHGAAWHPYDGVSSHDEHIHAEVTVDAGRVLTVDYINKTAAAGGEPTMVTTFWLDDGFWVSFGGIRSLIKDNDDMAKLKVAYPNLRVLPLADHNGWPASKLGWSNDEVNRLLGYPSEPRPTVIVELSNDDIERLAARVADIWTDDDNDMSIKDAVKAALREGVGPA